MATEEEEILFKMFKGGAMQAVKQGSIKAHIPDDISKFMARQLSFTIDLVKKGGNLTPAYLSLLLAQKGLGIANLAMGKRADCGIAVVLLAISLTISAGFTAFTGPMHFTVTAAELLSECYSVDKTCGVSEPSSLTRYSRSMSRSGIA